MKMIRKVVILSTLLFGYIAKAQNIDTVGWKNIFTDSILVKMIDRAIVCNNDLRVAHLNVLQSQISLTASRRTLLPSLNIGIENTATKSENISQLSYNIPLTMQWEIDLSKRLRNERLVAEAIYWETQEIERSIKLQVVASVVAHYYTLIMLDEQLSIIRQSIDINQQTIEVLESMKEVGEQNEVALSLARISYFNTVSQEKSLLQQIGIVENTLSVLLGEKVKNIPRSELNEKSINIDYEASYPLSVLAERPDVKAAEYALKRMTAQTAIARSAFYPSLTISASAGWTNHIGEVINPQAILFNAIGSLVQPLFNKGQNIANLSIAKIQQEQALIAFNHSLLVAGTELYDALNICKLSAERCNIRQQEIKIAEYACKISLELMKNSSNTYLEVLSAQTALLQSRLAYTTDWMDNIQGMIDLYKALGGNIKTLQK